MAMDKRYTLKQVMDQVHGAYDKFEAAAKQALREEFGFGEKRIERFMMRLKKKARFERELQEAEMRRKRRRY